MIHEKRFCVDCGAKLEGFICGHCGTRQGLDSFGFKTKKALGKGYVLLDIDGNPVYTFGSLGTKTATDLVDRTSAPREVIEIELAKLADSSPHIEETEEETIILVKYLPSITTSEFIAEQIWDGKTAPVYALKRFDDDKIDYISEMSLGESDDKGREIFYRPVYNDHLLTGMVTVPQKPVDSSFEDVIADAFDYLGQTDFFDPCGKIEQVRLCGMVSMGSWFLDRMIPKTSIPIAGVGRYAPIIPIRGPSETGKNRLANMYRFLSYRPFFDQSTSRIPSLFRPLDLWKGTLVMDEADFYKTGPHADIIHFLNCRATGTPISRQNPDKVAVSQVFESFGITILTQRQHFDDNATESRSVPYYTERTAHKLPTIELDEVVEWGLKLQNKLLFLRLMYWNQFEIDKRYWVSGISDHRLNAALLPTISLSKFEPKIAVIIEECVAPLERTKREIKANSMDGMLVNLIWDKIDSGNYAKHNQMYYVLDEWEPVLGEEGEVVDQLPISLTTKKIEEQIGFKGKTIRKILNSLKIAPDGAPKKIRVGRGTPRVIFFQPDKLEKEFREFVVDYTRESLYERIHLEPPDSVPLVADVPLPTPPYSSGEDENTIPRTPMGGIEVPQVPQVAQKGLVLGVEEEKVIVDSMLASMKREGQVGELWPRVYLEDKGILRKDAENIIEGIRQAGHIIQDEKTKTWRVKK